MARVVEPEHLSRGYLPPKCVDDLEAVCVNSLAGLTRQLGSLSQHANAIFSEILVESMSISRRVSIVKQRAASIQVALDKLEYKKADLTPVMQTTAFRRKEVTEQQVISRASVPAPILEEYKRCESSPALNEMDPYRDDGKVSLEFFTEPGYFFRMWVEKMKKETDNKSQQKVEKRRKKKKNHVTKSNAPSERKKVDRVKKKEYSAMGAEFAVTPSAAPAVGGALAAAPSTPLSKPDAPPPPIPAKPQSAPPPPPSKPNLPPPPPPSGSGDGPSLHSPPSAPPPPLPPSISTTATTAPPMHAPPIHAPPSFPPPPVHGDSGPDFAKHNALQFVDDENTYAEVDEPVVVAPPSFAPPPPPPAAPAMSSEAIYGNSNQPAHHTPHHNPAPGMPPPPPPPAFHAPPPPPGVPHDLGVGVKNAGNTSGNDLLDAILNKRLRSVTREERTQSTMSSWKERSDVAAILARRMAVEESESDGDSDSEEDWSDG